MNQVTAYRFLFSGLALALLLVFAAPVFADSKDENLKPLEADKIESNAAQPEPEPGPSAISAELEAKYRTELESRLAQERKSYEGSLRSLWLANSAVWAVLLGFIVFQAVGVRKRSAELARLKQQRESGE